MKSKIIEFVKYNATSEYYEYSTIINLVDR